MNGCAYIREDGSSCPFEPWEGSSEGHCIGHDENNNCVAEDVWALARNVAATTERRVNLEGWVFPPDPHEDYFKAACLSAGHLSFRSCRFRCPVSFEGATLEATEQSGAVSFIATRFDELALFDRCTFDGLTSFQEATFRGASFKDAVFGSLTIFTESKFLGDKTDLSNARFSAGVQFTRASCEGEIRFDGVRFLGITDFDESTFAGIVFFLGARFRERASFGRAQLSEATILIDRPHWEFVPFVPCSPFAIPADGIEVYRHAASSAELNHRFSIAAAYRHAEKCAVESGHRQRYGNRLFSHRFLECLLEFVFGRLVFAYCELPLRPLYIGVIVILLWASMAWTANGVQDTTMVGAEHQATFTECLYFSTVTFTTLGYGDFAPRQDFRIQAALEAWIGGFLMATFVVALTYRYVRPHVQSSLPHAS